jgi:hypothetical protein
MTAQEEFWNWFIRNEPDLFDFDPSELADHPVPIFRYSLENSF